MDHQQLLEVQGEAFSPEQTFFLSVLADHINGRRTEVLPEGLD